MPNKKPNWTSWVLRFVGSLAYLGVVWQLWQAGLSSANILNPILFGLAVVTSIAFFFVTLADLMGNSDIKTKDWSMKTNFYAGFALLALVAPAAGTWALIALVGFILAYIGSGMDR
ncbi:MAG: hypothetical protein KGH64_00220 [Candidatus Micrarchaeota archaeon]|nr:hypothetical protein [Candidatus Micrarchaeota archaeon]MDE1833740.1 hypothetical protein [Candidatus Micrarchaeota archaeon]MDE1859627.1 hypothetical protein [Candidatus Micrarchaeota archaeon]